MKVLLTGGSGFVGRNIVEMLGKKHEIVAPTHKELELADQDAMDAYFKGKKFDVVIHSAVKPGHRAVKDKSNQITNNTLMFFNLVKNSDKWGKLIFLSSGMAYDMRFYTPKMKEEYFGEHIPVDEGGLSKYIIGKFIERSDDMIDLRPFSVFGKYENYSVRFISNLVCMAVFDMPLMMNQNRKYDFIYIDDLVDTIGYFIENKAKQKAYNVSPDASIELLEAAKIIKKVSGKDIEIIVKEKGMGIEYSGDNTRLKNEFKALRLHKLEDAIEKLYGWYTDNKNNIKKETLFP